LSTAILKIRCIDSRGIVYALSKYILERQGNIIHSTQHHDPESNYFFIWIKIDILQMNCTRGVFESGFQKLADKFKMTWQVRYADQIKRMAILVSKHDHCLYDLILRQKYGELQVDIPLIISNHPDLENVGQHFKIPYHHIPVPSGDKEKSEQSILDLCKKNAVDFMVLARYMQILGKTLLNAYPNEIINVHHGFLPAFVGAKPYHQAYEKGVKIIGATGHYATEDLDMGPIIEQQTVRVDHSMGPGDMITLGRDIETQVLATAVKAHIDDRIFVYNNRTIIFN